VDKRGIGLELSGNGHDGFVRRLSDDGSDGWIGKALNETFHSGGHGGVTDESITSDEVSYRKEKRISKT
jgi:hypothetical protein